MWTLKVGVTMVVLALCETLKVDKATDGHGGVGWF